jgi:L-seryl-tRNA(Ser) seleniumtransferase
MKVNKEEILGMLVAIELFLARDHEAQWKAWENQIKMIHDAALSVPGVKGEIHVPEIANHVPALKISWDETKVKAKPGDIRNALRDGHPSIETMGNDKTIDITTWMMNPGEERIVAKRLKDLLQGAALG